MPGNCFNEEIWRERIKKPDWYLLFISEYQQLEKTFEENTSEWEKCKKITRQFFAQQLQEGNVALGDRGKNFDADRKKIDHVVIHHTHNTPNITPDYLSAIILLRLYAPYYAKPYDPNDSVIQGTPIYSGHFRDGRQVFYPYHWIVRGDGSFERLLNDNEIGWHAGNWEMNVRSIGIVLDNNYENSKPAEQELSSIAQIIKEQYPDIRKEHIVGHQEVNHKTSCPSNLFLSKNGTRGWKEDLLALL